MANRNFNPVQALEKEIKIITGRINLNASAAVLTTGSGIGFSVAKNGTGTYDITLQDRYPKLLGADFSWLEAAASANGVKIISETVNSATPIVKIKTCPNSSGTPTDVAAACSIFFTLHLKNQGT